MCLSVCLYESVGMFCVCLFKSVCECLYVSSPFVGTPGFRGPTLTHYGLPRWLSGKDSPANAGDTEICVQSLGQKDPLEQEMETHSSILAWENSMERGAWRATVHGVAKSQT